MVILQQLWINPIPETAVKCHCAVNARAVNAP